MSCCDKGPGQSWMLDMHSFAVLLGQAFGYLLERANDSLLLSTAIFIKSLGYELYCINRAQKTTWKDDLS